MKKYLSFLLAMILMLSSLTVLVQAQTVDEAEVGAGSVENAVVWAINIANDDSHGYSQSRRTGPDYDCSSFVSTAFKQAGFNVSNTLNTGNMKDGFINAGFTWIASSSISGFPSSSTNLKRGDILLANGHTALYIGSNQVVHARGGTYDKYDEGHPGDQTGKEIMVQTYGNYTGSGGWLGILRYSGSSPNSYAPWDKVYADGITETNAVLHGHVSPEQKITSAGVQVGTSVDNLKLWCEDYASSFVDIWYDLNSKGKTLKPGTKYYYRFFFYNGANYLIFSEIKSFTTNKRSISKATITLSQSSYTYDGTAKQPTVVVKDGSTTLTNGTHYTVAYSNNINVGTATVTVSGKGSYNGSVNKNFTISTKQISNTSISLGETSYTYDGTAKQPTVVVKDGSNTLTSGTHYSVAYSNNTNVGTATVTISGLGNYIGSTTKIFTISAKQIGNTSIALGETTYTYDGTAKTPSVTVTDGNKTLVNGTDYSVSYANNIYAGTGSVTITGSGNYAGTSVQYFTISQPPTVPPTEPPTENPPVDPDAPRIVVENKSASAGGTVDVDISLENNPGIASMKLEVEYGDDLTLTQVTYNDDLGGSYQLPQKYNSPVILNWYNGSDNTYGDMIFATLTFTVSENAVNGSVNDITLTYNPNDVFNISENNIAFEVQNGAVTVSTHVPGDINGDGSTNNKDLTRLFQYLSRWEVAVNADALDVNGDGSINNKDLTRLFQYLSRWEVVIY